MIALRHCVEIVEWSPVCFRTSITRYDGCGRLPARFSDPCPMKTASSYSWCGRKIHTSVGLKTSFSERVFLTRTTKSRLSPASIRTSVISQAATKRRRFRSNESPRTYSLYREFNLCTTFMSFQGGIYRPHRRATKFPARSRSPWQTDSLNGERSAVGGLLATTVLGDCYSSFFPHSSSGSQEFDSFPEEREIDKYHLIARIEPGGRFGTVASKVYAMVTQNERQYSDSIGWGSSVVGLRAAGSGIRASGIAGIARRDQDGASHPLLRRKSAGRSCHRRPTGDADFRPRNPKHSTPRRLEG